MNLRWKVTENVNVTSVIKRSGKLRTKGGGMLINAWILDSWVFMFHLNYVYKILESIWGKDKIYSFLSIDEKYVLLEKILVTVLG